MGALLLHTFQPNRNRPAGLLVNREAVQVVVEIAAQFPKRFLYVFEVFELMRILNMLEKFIENSEQKRRMIHCLFREVSIEFRRQKVRLSHGLRDLVRFFFRYFNSQLFPDFPGRLFKPLRHSHNYLGRGNASLRPRIVKAQLSHSDKTAKIVRQDRDATKSSLLGSRY